MSASGDVSHLHLPQVAEGELEHDATGFREALAVGLSSTAPAYSLAAVSAIATTQTTIIPSSRTSFSMARQRALPRAFAAIHPRFHTPWFSTSVIAALAILWYVPVNLLSENFLFDTLSALSLMIAFYYALTGLACAIYYRRELTKSVKNFLFIGVGPLVGAGILGFLFVKSSIDLSDPANSYSEQVCSAWGCRS
jgi:amino acid transporter